MVRFLTALLLTLAALMALSSAPLWAQSIGIIQYNVKAGQGGWDKVSSQQIALIANTIKRKQKHNPVDFIALQQADLKPGLPSPPLSDALVSHHIKGFKTIISACHYDTTQISYSRQWRLAGNSIHNPLVNGITPQFGWLYHGCQGMAGSKGGRPYNMAYFVNKKNPRLKILFVSNHFPHPEQGHFDSAGFLSNAKLVTGEPDLNKVKLIVAGDMNTQSMKRFSDVFGRFGNLKVSRNLLTCCQNDHWRYAFDHVISNSSQPVTAEIIPAHYPLNKTKQGINEEHKALFATVNFQD